MMLTVEKALLKMDEELLEFATNEEIQTLQEVCREIKRRAVKGKGNVNAVHDR